MDRGAKLHSSLPTRIMLKILIAEVFSTCHRHCFPEFHLASLLHRGRLFLLPPQSSKHRTSALATNILRTAEEAANKTSPKLQNCRRPRLTTSPFKPSLLSLKFPTTLLSLKKLTRRRKKITVPLQKPAKRRLQQRQWGISKTSWQARATSLGSTRLDQILGRLQEIIKPRW